MTNSNYDHFIEILIRAYDTTNCDFRFVLRNILCRGAEEANYLSFQFEGKVAEAFRRAKIYLEGIVSDLPHMLDGDGSVLHRHRATIREAVTLARYLIAIERDQTAGQLDMLEERLRNPRRSEDRRMSKAA
jgi:hypothetical protein